MSNYEDLNLSADPESELYGSCYQSNPNNDLKVSGQTWFLEEDKKVGHFSTTSQERKAYAQVVNSLPIGPQSKGQRNGDRQQFYFDDSEEIPEKRNKYSDHLQRDSMVVEQKEEKGPSKEGRGSGKKKKAKNQNKFITKNMIQFFFKAFKNYFEKFATIYDQDFQDEWRKFMQEYELNKERRLEDFRKSQKQKDPTREVQNHNTTNFSLSDFTKLFRTTQLRKHLFVMFKTRYLFRAIAGSGIALEYKQEYKKFIPVIIKGFKFRKIERLHE